MKDYKKLKFILLITAIILWAFSIYFGNIGINKSVGLRYEDKSVSVNDIENIKINNNNIPDITLWDEYKGSIENEQNTTDVCVITVYGNTNSVFNKFIKGNLLKDDYNGCAISTRTAYEIFGSIDILEKEIKFNNENFIIRCIIDSNKKLFVLNQKNYNENMRFVELEFDSNINNIKNTKNFIIENNLPEPYSIIDGYSQNYILNIFCHIPAWVIFLVIIINFIKCLFKIKNMPILFLIFLLIFVFIIIFLKVVVEFNIKISDDFIPSKWSDFSFWSYKIEEIKESIIKFIILMPVERDINFRTNIILCIIFSILSTIFIIIFSIFDTDAQLFFVSLIISILVSIILLLKSDIKSPFYFNAIFPIYIFIKNLKQLII